MIPALLAARAAPVVAGVIAMAALIGYATVQRYRAEAATARAATATAEAAAYQNAVRSLQAAQEAAAAAARQHAGTIATLRSAHDRDATALARAADGCLDAGLPDDLRRLLGPGAGADAAADARPAAPARGG